MTKTGTTKNKILKMIASGNYTLSDISTELNLAPSTVSQHLQELEDMGAISEIENPHIKKWKHYKINPNFSSYGISKPREISQRPASRVVFYALGLLVAGIFAALLATSYVYSNNAQQYAGTAYVPLRITDPPKVPVGTSALVVSYSSLQVHKGNFAHEAWISVNGSGTLDLISLLNVSQVIGTATINQNAIVDMVRFNITSASITINGTRYNVTVPSRQITAHLSGNQRVNSSVGVLLDLSPIVAATYTNDSTVFVLVPSIKAVVVPTPRTVFAAVKVNANSNSAATSAIQNNSNNTQFNIGQRFDLQDNEKAQLYYSTPNVMITGASLWAYGNGSIALHVNVRNNGNASVLLNQIIIMGNQTPSIVVNNTCFMSEQNGINIAIAAKNTSTNILANASGNYRYPWCRLLGSSGAGKIKIKVAESAMPKSKSLELEMLGIGGSSNAGLGLGAGSGVDVVVGGTANDAIRVQNASIAWITRKAPGNANITLPPPSLVSQPPIPPYGIRIRIKSDNSTLIKGIANGTIAINGTIAKGLIYPKPIGVGSNASITMPVPALMPIIEQYRSIDFTILQNGTLTQTNYPNIYAKEELGQMIPIKDLWYSMGAHSNTIFNYTGALNLGQGLRINLVSGARYRIAVLGDFGAYAIINVTAG